VAKNRQGPVAIAEARWEGTYVRVVEQ
jgi:hypothetical protein